jgi:hypothetical protein
MDDAIDLFHGFFSKGHFRNQVEVETLVSAEVTKTFQHVFHKPTTTTTSHVDSKSRQRMHQ